ncbi:MAG: hypothetical protein ACE5MK_13805, partial [Acidobacteriota bacterium]
RGWRSQRACGFKSRLRHHFSFSIPLTTREAGGRKSSTESGKLLQAEPLFFQVRTLDQLLSLLAAAGLGQQAERFDVKTWMLQVPGDYLDFD